MAAAAETPLSAQHHASKFTSRQKTFALVIVALAFVMDLLDSTIVNIAIPSIQANLHASYSAIQWLIAGYLLSFATLLITGGRMGDVFGYKKLFMAGVAGFTLASLLSGLAWSPGILIAARLFQGAMAALMVPQVMSMMQILYDQKERGQVMGLFGALGGMAATLGPIIGGLLIQWNIAGLDWRPIFLINIPVGLFAFFAGAKVLPSGKSEHPLNLDITGTFIVMALMFLILFPLVQGRELGWPVWTFIMLASALPVLAIFTWYERRKNALDSSPLVVPSLFKTKSFVSGLIVNVFFEMLFIGFFLINTLMMQIGLGYSVIRAALTGIPFAIGIGLAIGIGGQKLIPKLGRYVIHLGLLFLAIGYVSTALLIHHYALGTHSWQLLGPLFISGIGAGLSMGPIFSVVLTDVDTRHAGSASGVLNAIQQVGGAVGIAAIGVIFFGLISSHAMPEAQKLTPQIASQLTAAGLPAAASRQVADQFVVCFHDRSTEKNAGVTPDSCKVGDMGTVPASVSNQIQSTLAGAGKQANERNFSNAFSWSVGFILVLLALTYALSFLLPRHIQMQEELAV